MKKNNPRNPFLWVGTLTLAIWVFLHQGILSYVLHHPSSLSSLFWVQMGRVLLRLVWMGWFLLLSRSLGYIFLKNFRISFASHGEQWITETALGLGILSYVLFLCGLLGLWHKWVLGLLGTLGTLVFIRDLNSWRAIPLKFSLKTWTQKEAWVLLPITLALLYGVVNANAPPTDWDSLAVHLALPKLYAEWETLRPAPWRLHAWDPMALEMLYIPSLLWKDPASTAMVSLLFQALMAAALFVVGRQIFSFRGALLALSLFLVQPAVISVSGTSGTDFGVGLYGLLGFWCTWRWKQSRQSLWLYLSGIFSGLAMSCKLTGLLLAAALGILLLFSVLGKKATWKDFLAWTSMLLLWGSPWYLRTAIYTGNPVWPHFSSLFHGTPRDLILAAKQKMAVMEGVGHHVSDLLLLPLHLLFQPEKFRYGSQFLMIPFFILGIASGRDLLKNSFTRWVLSYIGLFTLGWFYVLQSWRYFIPLFPWMALLVCYWSQEHWSQKSWKRILSSTLAIGFIPLFSLSANNALFPVLGLTSQQTQLSPEEAYLSHSINSYPAMDFLNKNLTSQDKILLFREVRGFYLDKEYLVGDPQNETLIPYENMSSPLDLYHYLRALGITCVLVNPSLITFNPNVPEFQKAEHLMKATLAQFAQPPLNMGSVLLYSWKNR
ncbi:MAG: glycosyltransferase family 39 protein [Elusimicrobia bacterium]|nr:glycosyltransferase family 39 protein [Elusimicrobiota bacterium]